MNLRQLIDRVKEMTPSDTDVDLPARNDVYDKLEIPYEFREYLILSVVAEYMRQK